ncbi:regulator of chromosome condensation 1/beta-lactamase-inhibitor protein II [Pyronema omphalodes]|nr:regulator of chromosome condensation 1/beta-lactamase-inhibitor protein II [Pyronema omphalodes]
MLFSFGSNGGGQLSLGHTDDTHIPHRCKIPTSFPSIPPKQIVAGGNHTLVLFPCGTLFAAGSNTYGQCGLPVSAGTTFTSFQLIPSPGETKWKLVSAGWDFSIFVTDDDKIFVCGMGSKGELGLGENLTQTELRRLSQLCPSEENKKVIDIASGMSHTITILEDGTMYGWGAARKGQLGTGDEKVVNIPRKIEVEFKVAKAVCGREFSFVVSEDGERHEVFGGDRFGVKAEMPEQGGLKGWKLVGSCWGSVVVLMMDGSIKAWGRNDKGQLPPGGLKDVRSFAIGSEHGVAIAGDRLVAWGWGEHGNCGNEEGGDIKGKVHEVKVDGDGELMMVGAGCATSWVWKA